MALAALIVAVVGLLLGAGSLVWQLWSFFLSGPRIRVLLQQGLRGGDSVMVAPPGVYTEQGRQAVALQGYDEHVLTITVVNSGRLPTTVLGWEIVFGNGVRYTHPRDPENAQLPARLESDNSAMWTVPLDRLLSYQANFADQSDTAATVYAFVRLGAGRDVRSRERLVLKEPVREVS